MNKPKLSEKKTKTQSPSLWDIQKLLTKWWIDKANTARLLEMIQDWEERAFIEEYQWALSYWAESMKDTQQKVIITLDGRDTAGKWSNIKRVTEQLDIRRYAVKAFPGIPTDEEKFEHNWFRRYQAFFPQEWGVRFFDRSWYNRAWVEAAMWFCTEEEYNWFMTHVNGFEKEEIVDKGFDFLKIHLSITKDTQKERLNRRKHVRKRWKSSPIDAQAQEKWWFYTLAKQKMLELTDSAHAPWIVLDSNEKFLSAVEIIKAMVWTSHEVRKLIEKDLSIDLSPNFEVRRTAEQELERMRKAGQIPSDKEFQFRVVE